MSHMFTPPDTVGVAVAGGSDFAPHRIGCVVRNAQVVVR
jgi:hypothetical protein